MRKLGLVVLVTFLVLGLGVSAQASLTQVFSSAGMTDSVDWGQLGPTSTAVSNPVAATSALGLSMAVSTPSGTMLRVDEGYGNGWYGNFTPGDKLLWTDLNNGPMTIAFASPVNSAGANIQADYFGAFTGSITAYDGITLLGTFNLNGNSNSNDDGSAIFLGLQSSAYDITSIAFDVSSVTGNNDFAINQLNLSPSAVPIPGAVLLLAPGLVGLAGIRRRFVK